MSVIKTCSGKSFFKQYSTKRTRTMPHKTLQIIGPTRPIMRPNADPRVRPINIGRRCGCSAPIRPPPSSVVPLLMMIASPRIRHDGHPVLHNVALRLHRRPTPPPMFYFQELSFFWSLLPSFPPPLAVAVLFFPLSLPPLVRLYVFCTAPIICFYGFLRSPLSPGGSRKPARQ